MGNIVISKTVSLTYKPRVYTEIGKGICNDLKSVLLSSET